jgi:hypothetical protein
MDGSDAPLGPALRHAPGLRLRPVPELGFCIAYTPARPRLHRLNPTAWLVLELAPGRTAAALQEAFLAATAGRLDPGVARWHADDAVAMMRRAGILEIDSGGGDAA